MRRKIVYTYQDIFCEFRGESNLEDVKILVKALYHTQFSENKVIKQKLRVGYHTLFSVQGNGRFRNHGIKEDTLLKQLTNKDAIDRICVLFKKENNLGSPHYGKSQIIFNTESLVSIFNKEIK